METWKEIPGHEGYYEASNLGRIKSVRRFASVIGHPNPNYTKKLIPEKILNPMISKRGYPVVTLWKNNVGKKRPIHIFITRTIFGNPRKGYNVNHKDGNKLNNHIDNLEYVTHRENINHAFRNGLRVMPKGEKHCCARIKESDVISIREEFSKGNITKKALGDKYKIHPSHIGRIISGRYWSHIPRHSACQEDG